MRPAGRWLLGRLPRAVIVLVGAATVTFVAFHLLPGDPARVSLGTPNPTAQLVATTRHQMGLDRPLAQQYLVFVGRLARGDLGMSYQLHEPVAGVIGRGLWPTVELALAAFALAVVVAVPLAVATAGRRRASAALSWTVELVLISSPSFWIGILLLTLFSFDLRLFPVISGTSARGLVLPAVTLAASIVGVLTQILREGLERALDEPFTTSARARGSGETGVRLRHGLRHTLIPLLTTSGWILGALFTGSVVVETVFSRQGLGRVAAAAITGRDLPTVTGVVVVSALAFTVLNIALDAAYHLVDPRLREAAA